jgi:hypothetical protein
MIQQHHRALCEEASETLANLTIIFAALALTNHDGRGGGACNVKRAMPAN